MKSEWDLSPTRNSICHGNRNKTKESKNSSLHYLLSDSKVYKTDIRNQVGRFKSDDD